MVVKRESLLSPATIRSLVLVGLGVAAGLLVPIAGVRVAVLLIGGLLALAAVVWTPGLVFGLYLLIPFYKGGVQQYVPVDITVILAALNAVQVVRLVLHPPRRGNISGFGLALWIAIAVLVLFGVLYAPDQRLALSHAINYWFLVLAALSAGALVVGSDRRYVDQMLWTFFGVGVINTLFGITSLSDTARLTVLGQNTINAAMSTLLVPLVGITFVLRRGSSLVRLATIALIPVSLVVALATGSRGPILVLILLAIPGLIRALARLRSADPKRTLLGAGIGVAIVLVLFFASSDLPVLATNRFAVFGEFIQSTISGDTVGAATSDTSSTARVGFFGAALTMFGDRPILGYGTGGFEAMSQSLLGQVEAYPHNAMLQFASEFGLVGVGLFISLIAVTFVRKLPDWAGPVPMLAAYFLLEAMFSNDIFSDRATWGLLLLCLVIRAPALVGARAPADRAASARAPLPAPG
jgi:hypothetical protein